MPRNGHRYKHRLFYCLFCCLCLLFAIKAIGTQFSSTDIRSREIFARAVASRWLRCRATLSRGQGLGKGSGVRHICLCHLLMLVPAQPSSLILAMSWCTQFCPCSADDLRVLEGSGALMGARYLTWKFAVRCHLYISSLRCQWAAWNSYGFRNQNWRFFLSLIASSDTKCWINLQYCWQTLLHFAYS